MKDKKIFKEGLEMINKQDLLDISNNAQWVEFFLCENIYNMHSIPFEEIQHSIYNCKEIQYYISDIIKKLDTDE